MQQPRVFTSSRVVHGGDAGPGGRLRLDALARYLQDAAEDDVADARLSEPRAWVVRRCAIQITAFPRFGQQLTVRTFCSATGPRWAERTTTLSAGQAELVVTRAVWAAVTRDTGESCPLGEEFHRLYGRSAAGRRVSARLTHPRPPLPPAPGPGAVPGAGAPAGSAQPWPLRASDFDAQGHVNNSVHWAAVEQAVAGLGWLPSAAEVEYREPALPGCQPRLALSAGPDEAWMWLLGGGSDGGQPLASARITRG